MTLNIHNLFKNLTFIFFFTLGIIFLIQGFKVILGEDYKISQLKKLEENEIIIKTKKIKIIDKISNYQNVSQKNEGDKLKESVITVKKGDTFSNIINPYFDDNKIKNLIIKQLNKKYDLKNLNIGQKIYLYENKLKKIEQIILPINFDKEVLLNIEINNVVIEEKKIKIYQEIKSLKFTIMSSLYEDGIKAGVPLEILSNAIRLYSFDIDFQRDIKKNTELEISYEKLINSKRGDVGYGNIKYINLKFKKINLEYFIFKTNENINDYFNKEGKNIKKSLLKTPIDGGRLSSNFGMRKHPISGYNKLHKGVDFAAPKGTPVYAGGDGIIDYVGSNGGYGKYIRIRHNNEYKTAYAHLSRFKKDLYKGLRVNQGEIIGYVGSTGNSTGPHLHYEILYKNKHLNPMTLKLPSGKILKGKELGRFKKNMNSIYSEYLFNLYE